MGCSMKVLCMWDGNHVKAVPMYTGNHLHAARKVEVAGNYQQNGNNGILYLKIMARRQALPYRRRCK